MKTSLSQRLRGARVGNRRSNELVALVTIIAVSCLAIFVVGASARDKPLSKSPSVAAKPQLKPHVRKHVYRLRVSIRGYRKATWQAQRVYGATPWKSLWQESHAIGIPYLRHLETIWKSRMVTAQNRAAEWREEQQYSYKGANPNVKLGQRMAKSYGWHRGWEWEALYTLWNYESGWNHRAYNPSGACGIPQDMGNCHDWNPGAQIAWGLRYIESVYGSPSRAYAFWRANNWY